MLGILAAVAAALGLPAATLATFPGANGEIAFNDLRDPDDISTIDPGGGHAPRYLTFGSEPAYAASVRRYRDELAERENG